MTTNVFRFALVAAVLAAGCGKKKSDKESAPEGKSAPTEAKPAKPAGPDFSAWDMAGKQKAWEGSWLARENGTIQAWTVTGTKVQTWDGEKEKAFELAMDAPCQASFKTAEGMMFPRPFSVVDGAIQFRAEGAGYRKGAEAIYCDASGSIYVLAADGTCTLWDKKFDDWTSKPGDCKLTKNADGAEVFAHGDPNGGEMEIRGDAILSHSSFETQKVDGDFAAAKAARDAKAAQ